MSYEPIRYDCAVCGDYVANLLPSHPAVRKSMSEEARKVVVQAEKVVDKILGARQDSHPSPKGEKTDAP